MIKIAFVFVVVLVCLTQTRVDASFDETTKKSSKSMSRSTAPRLSSNSLRQVYVDYCLHCHGRDGRPMPLVDKVMPEIPDFSHFDWEDYEPSDIVASIADGTGQMPGFKKLLTKQEMESLAWLLTKFPMGKPGSLIERRGRFRKANEQLIEKASEIEGKLDAIREVRVEKESNDS